MVYRVCKYVPKAPEIPDNKPPNKDITRINDKAEFIENNWAILVERIELFKWSIEYDIKNQNKKVPKKLSKNPSRNIFTRKTVLRIKETKVNIHQGLSK